MTYRARPAQHAILRGVLRTPRHQLIGGMGVGKTGSAILAAGVRELTHGFWPGMFVLAPLQVGFGWRREAPNWRPDLKTVLVAGTEKDRKAALHSSADIYIMGYENLPWLHKYGPKNWATLANMLVADESQRLRATRVSVQTSTLGNKWLRKDGGVQTNALAEHAGDFAYYLGMTGTPCPNGLQNWWPQMWYVDGGARLGNSYTAFENRWFMNDPYNKSDFPKKIPTPWALAEITEAIKDVTTVVRTEDFFDVAEPNVVDRVVELPAKARKQYNEMRDKMRAQLNAGQIIAETGAAKVARLLQVAAGFAYFRDDELDPDLQQCEVLHTAKLDAVESILNETDEPLVVFFQHKATLQMMQERFKSRLRTLDKKGVAQDDWNAGKIELLAIQYQAGAEGLSLQHGGRNMCFIEPTHRADSYEQAIERLGPLRQMQSGYNRTVNLFRIVAHNTHDQKVYQNLAEKIDTQDTAIELLMQ